MNRTIRWPKRLGAKLAALIALLTLAIVGCFAYAAVRVQERLAIAEMRRGAAQLSETIKSSIYHHMLADDRRYAYLTIETIGQQKGIESVRMFNETGRVTFSTEPKEVGRTYDRQAAACAGCHGGSDKGRLPDAGSDSRILPGKPYRTLSVTTPILNEKSCWTAACHAHPEEKKVLGVLDIGLALDEADASITSLGRLTLGIAAGAVALLIAAVLLFVRSSVLRPVRDLVQGTHRVAGNNLEGEIPVRSDDELGLLARSFNQMITSLRRANLEIRGLMENLEHQVEDRTRALKLAQDQLVQSEKMSSLGKLSASIAHEINNPLMGILTTSKLLIRTLDGGEVNDKARESCMRQLKMVQRETERCSAIVRNLLDFARQRPLALKDTDVNAVLEEALSVAAHQIALQETRLEKALGATRPVRADLGQMRQAFLNLALNAIEAMGKGGTLAVTSRDTEGGGVEVEIGDTGPGIPPEVLPKIFDPFFTTKEKGTGLGLSVVYGIIERHGGKIEVRTQAGQGTQMIIRLPGAAAAAA